MKKSELNRFARKFEWVNNSIRNKVYDIIETGLIPLLEQVPDGYLNLQDEDCDAIYGISIDYEMIGEHEMRIRGIRLYEGCVWLFMTPVTGQVEYYSDEDMLSEFPYSHTSETHWIPLLCDIDVLFVPTTMAIIESITKYVK